jgi:hypothetical protein
VECSKERSDTGRIIYFNKEASNFRVVFPTASDVLSLYCLAIDEGIVTCNPAESYLEIDYDEFYKLHAKLYPGFEYRSEN